MNVHINATGTMADRFRIGKAGPTILQGDDAPNPALGSTGDIYVQKGAEARLFVKRGGTWATNGGPSWLRETVPLGGSINVGADATYVGITASGTPGATTVVLPAGSANKKIIVKDESGQAATHLITIAPSGADTIEGQPTLVIDCDHGCVTLIFVVDRWLVIGSY